LAGGHQVIMKLTILTVYFWRLSLVDRTKQTMKGLDIQTNLFALLFRYENQTKTVLVHSSHTVILFITSHENNAVYENKLMNRPFT